MKRPAIFLDRDGTLIEDCEYLADPARVRVLDGVAQGLRHLRAAGFACVIVTNQSGIGRGMLTEADYQRVHDAMIAHLGAEGADIDAAYFCPVAPRSADPLADEHPDRKPNPGMLLRAAAELDLDLSRSWMIGDAVRDLVAGVRAGCRGGILVTTGKPVAPGALLAAGVVGGFTTATFDEAVNIILRSN